MITGIIGHVALAGARAFWGSSSSFFSAAAAAVAPALAMARCDSWDAFPQCHEASLTHWLLPGRTHAELLGPADGTLAGDGGTSVFKDHLLGFQGVSLLTAFKAVDLVTGSTGHRLLLVNVSYE